MSGPLSIDQAYSQAVAMSSAGLLNYQTDTVTSGSTVTMAAGMAVELLKATTTLAAVTIKLPPSPVDRQLVRLASQAAVTVLSVQDSAGNAVAQLALGVFGVGALFQFQGTSWQRIG